MTELAFWVIAIVLVSSALAVVLLRNVFRAALLLIVCFFAVAALYITLNADFLAAGGDLGAAMEGAGWGENERQEMLCAFVSLRGEVVTR